MLGSLDTHIQADIPRAKVRVCCHHGPLISPRASGQKVPVRDDQSARTSGSSRPQPRTEPSVVRPGSNESTRHESHNQREVAFPRCYRLVFGDIVANHDPLAVSGVRLILRDSVRCVGIDFGSSFGHQNTSKNIPRVCFYLP